VDLFLLLPTNYVFWLTLLLCISETPTLVQVTERLSNGAWHSDIKTISLLILSADMQCKFCNFNPSFDLPDLEVELCCYTM
jgi:hypothetical protein